MYLEPEKQCISSPCSSTTLSCHANPTLCGNMAQETSTTSQVQFLVVSVNNNLISIILNKELKKKTYQGLEMQCVSSPFSSCF